MSPAARITERPSSFSRCHAILPIVVVLPEPLTPTIIRTAGRFETSMRGSPVSATLGEQLDQAVARRLGPLDVARLDLHLELADDLGRGAGAHVGEDQRLLEALPGPLVEVVADARGELGAERVAALREALAQAAEDAAAGFAARFTAIGLGRLRERSRGRRRRRLVPASLIVAAG